MRASLSNKMQRSEIEEPTHEEADKSSQHIAVLNHLLICKDNDEEF